MTRTSKPSTRTEAQRVRFTVPQNDTRVWTWLRHQTNVAHSIRLLIGEAIRAYGNVDVTCVDFKLQRADGQAPPPPVQPNVIQIPKPEMPTTPVQAVPAPMPQPAPAYAYAPPAAPPVQTPPVATVQTPAAVAQMQPAAPVPPPADNLERQLEQENQEIDRLFM